MSQEESKSTRLQEELENTRLDVAFWEEKTTWKPAHTAPKTGDEFLTCNMRQGGVMQLVSWNTIHHHWQSKGELVWEHSFTHWIAIHAPQEYTS